MTTNTQTQTTPARAPLDLSENEERAVRILKVLHEKRLLEKIADAFKHAALCAQNIGKRASIKLTFDLDPKEGSVRSQQLKLSADLEVKTPRLKEDPSTFLLTDDGDLTRSTARQTTIPETGVKDD